MKKPSTSIEALASVSSISEMKEVAWDEVRKSFESFCMMAVVENLTTMFKADAGEICGHRYGRGARKRSHRWGTTQGNGRAKIDLMFAALAVLLMVTLALRFMAELLCHYMFAHYPAA